MAGRSEVQLRRSAVRYGIRQCEVLGFVTIALGHRRVKRVPAQRSLA
jgi:hypothetical protein